LNELINIINDEVVTTSLQVAEVFGKRHTHVLEKIQQILKDSAENSAQCFKQSVYKDASGKTNIMYYINRKGFVFLVMGFTGRKADDWKWKYINAFDEMEQYINFRKADKQIQKNAMEFLHNNLDMPMRKHYCKANTIANKAVSNMFGFPKMVKKGEMTVEMLDQREPILNETVELMAVEDKYKLGISVSDSIYKRHAMIGGE
jgi:Rha family phage regulatory protein